MDRAYMVLPASRQGEDYTHVFEKCSRQSSSDWGKGVIASRKLPLFRKDTSRILTRLFNMAACRRQRML